MTKEKVLSLFNFSLNQSVDKFSMKLSASLDLGFTLTFFLMAMLLIFEFPPTQFGIISSCIALIIDVLLFFWIHQCKNPTYELPFLFFCYTITFAKLTFLTHIWYIIDSKKAPIDISIAYFLIPIFFILIALIVVREKYIATQYLKTHTIKQTQDFISKRKINRQYPLLIGLPMCPYTIIYIIRNNFEIPLTLAMWSLASIWLFLVILSGYNYLMAIKYHVFKIFKEKS